MQPEPNYSNEPETDRIKTKLLPSFVLVDFCPSGVLSSGVLSYWGFVLHSFMLHAYWRAHTKFKEVSSRPGPDV